ncbi:Major Facilitator Superfamily protein [Micromonospora rhizosphaerae]|uniref:Multidrug efflux pump Tap n=1 Tax=Micromonospora rhizosphaerae TaxID=568872 RepID=A0A1C6R7W6_9ACTN|nr:MFS transporter [Micromonospora rhizosphaerae]SCL13152.1 Major Facilitator Superfamily protein [Micromonospora rhizosphaerae]
MTRRRTPLVGLLAAELISLIGSRMSMVALPWFTLVTTGSAARTGLVAFAEMLPYVLACGLGGPLLDRVGARRVSVLADLASAAALAAVPLLYRLHHLHFGTLLGLIAAVGLLRGFGDTAKRVVFPETVAASGMALTRATALHDGLSRLATLLGAPLAGILIAALDAATVLALDAASFLLAGVVIAATVPARVRPAGRTAAVDGDPRIVAAGRTDLPGDGARLDRFRRYLASLAEGLRFLYRERLMGAVTLLLFVTNLADAAYSSVLAPLWAREVAGTPTALGVLSASFATGAVLGNVVFTAVAPRVPRFAVFTVGFLVAGAPRFIALAALDRLWSVYLISFVAGLSIAAVNPILGALVYERVPEALRARVLGPAHAISWAGIPLGGLLAGWAAAGLALPVACLLFGGAYLLVTLAPFVAPAWRELDRPPSIDRPPGAGDRVEPQRGETVPTG